jgi:hypothetical protein
VRLKSVRDSSIEELNERAASFVAACGYEHRSAAISQLIKGPGRKVAFCFKEWPDALARKDNEKQLSASGFESLNIGGNDSYKVQTIVGELLKQTAEKRALAFDISAMTRAWHGAIVRELRTAAATEELETFFTYVPAKFKAPFHRYLPNQFVGPVDGFASLSTPDLPVAAVIGLGYERERALGLKQLLDPERTVLMVPHTGENDPFYPEVLRSNAGLLNRTASEWLFEYSFTEPSATFATLASLISGLRESYRVVLASLGPKLFGLLCFLLAARFKDVSVWRVSSGIHGQPRPVFEDLTRVTVLSALWEP